MNFEHPAAVVLAAYDHPRSRQRFDAVVAEFSLDPVRADLARTNLCQGLVRALVVSGPQASGKDTVGPAVLAALNAGDHVRVGIADGLKREASELLLAMHDYPDRETGARRAADLLETPLEHARVLVDELWEVTRASDHGLTGWQRTPEIRRVLQYLGADARRDDPLRYVRLALPRIVDLLADGVSVYMGDGRFPREAEPCSHLGMFLVRLHVDPQVKAARLLARDGIIADPRTLHHEGEHALDSWDGVDLRIDNSHASRGEVVGAVAGAFALFAARLGRELA